MWQPASDSEWQWQWKAAALVGRNVSDRNEEGDAR